MPCGPKAALSCKGYFASEGIRYGRQLGRVSATHYEEIVVDQLYPGNAKLTEALQPLVVAAEERLKLDYAARQRTVLRIDAGGGSLSDVNWCLARGYQLHCKDFSSKRAEAWAATVEEWFTDPAHPERQMGWVIPMDTPDYVLPVRRIAIRHRKRNGQIWYQLLISTLEPRQVMELLSRPVEKIYEPELVALSYVQLYDKRGGAVEIEIKESKQGIGITRRRKKRAEAQQMVVLLNSLAHNVLVWARRWMSAPAPKLKRYGLLRLVRDVLSVSGFLQINEDGEITSIVLNRSSAVARNFITAFQATLTDEGVAVELSGT
jgi:hypothetical protein